MSGWRLSFLLVFGVCCAWACAAGDSVTGSSTSQGGAGMGAGLMGEGAGGTGGGAAVDGDGDGYDSDEDCDDANPDVHPGAEETCDGVDDNCSGDENDASDALTWYEDKDGDGYGISGVTTTACEQPAGYAEQADDCNDDDAAFHPGAPETDCADPNDYNCDGSVGYVDADQDGFAACEECNDADEDVFPGAAEMCNGQDDDCNGVADAQGGEDDDDNDGSYSCEDCDDDDPDNFPGNPEVCDGQDNNCNGQADFLGGEGDNDGDGSPACVDCDDNNPSNFPGNVEACDGQDNNCNGVADAPGGEGNADGDPALACIDCDDNDPTNYPGNIEICDGKDNDCNASNPDGSGQPGYGLPCDGPDTDLCNEGVNNCVNGVFCSDNTPNNIEICDGVDNDCNPATLDGSQQQGYGLPCDGPDADLCAEGVNSCINGVFCSDNTPNNVEICDALDQDCDGNVNEGPCNLDHATSTCMAGCLITSCNTGWCNLDNVHSTGCEFDLDTNPACGTSTNLGSVSGDTASASIVYDARGERHFRVYVSENEGGTSAESLCVRIQLDPHGVSMDYDLYARCDDCATEATAVVSSLAGSGAVDTVSLRWPEDTILGFPSGSDSGRWVHIFVKMFSANECDQYTLTVTGDVCPTLNTCGSK